MPRLHVAQLAHRHGFVDGVGAARDHLPVPLRVVLLVDQREAVPRR